MACACIFRRNNALEPLPEHFEHEFCILPRRRLPHALIEPAAVECGNKRVLLQLHGKVAAVSHAVSHAGQPVAARVASIQLRMMSNVPAARV